MRYMMHTALRDALRDMLPSRAVLCDVPYASAARAVL
jgi:hypothetical protein